MKYDPIEVEAVDKFIRYSFITENGKQWFYETGDIKKEKDVDEWDTHLGRKMWYTPEVREQSLNLMKKLV